MSIYITGADRRKEWRQHLVHTAINEDMHQDGEENDDTWRAGFLVGMALLIANATWLETESTSNLEDHIYSTILAARAERERAMALAERQPWVDAVARGKTDKGYQEWLADRD